MTRYSLEKAGTPCPKCGTELRSVLCVKCYGTGKSGKHACGKCGGTGVTTGCPNFRSHRPWQRIQKSIAKPSADAREKKIIWWKLEPHSFLGRYTNPFHRWK